MRSAVLGIDTSNYTTSAALYFPETGEVKSRKQLLSVEKGGRGLRQSEALFQHVKALPELLDSLIDEKYNILAVGASYAPTDNENSYMPCFLAGMMAAKACASALSVPYYEFSHQANHIAAAIFSSGQIALLKRKFIAFHVSGGTTDALFVSPDDKKIISLQNILSSLDLKAGQVIDRVGVALGLQFPAGQALDSLSQHSEREFKTNPFVRDGCPSFSGLENKCLAMLETESPQDIAKFAISYVRDSIEAMADEMLRRYGQLPLLFTGGVMSNSLIRKAFREKYNAFFAEPEFSRDNAVGTAFLTYQKFTGASNDFSVRSDG